MADYILAPQTVTVNFALEPALNTYNTISLLLQVDERSGFSEWITQLAQTLPDELKRELKYANQALHTGAIPASHWPSFPAYLDDLAQRDPVAMLKDSLAWVTDQTVEGQVTYETLVADRSLYLNFMRKAYEMKYADKEHDLFDESHFQAMYERIQHPHELLNTLVTNMRALWNDVLAEEWERNQVILRDSVAAFQQLDYGGSTPLEAIRAVTGRDLSSHWEATLGNSRQVSFIPSVHIGPYLMWFEGEEGVARIVFGARLPEGTRYESAALSRSELLVRLSALADDTRLQMLELLTKQDELCAQDIMTLLNLSQSSTSRHLRQLTATGYLIERRREVAKCYSLNPARFEDTLRALKRFTR